MTPRLRRSCEVGRSPEAGGTLPASLWALAVGALVMAPFLAYLSTSLLAGSGGRETSMERYAAEAGVEYGIWNLLNDTAFRLQVDVDPGTPYTPGPAITVNGLSPTMSAQAIPIGIWTSMANHPNTIGAGAALAHDFGDYIYALRGTGTQFRRYSISANSWTSLADTPLGIGNGGALTYVGGDYLYALRGGNNRQFYRYSISGNSWSTMALTPASIGAGAAMEFTGGNYLYALRGGGNRQFYRYSISGNSWSSMTLTPAIVGTGGSLTFAGGDYLYALRGRTTSDFYRYSISGNGWSTMTQTPQNIGGGGALAFRKSNWAANFSLSMVEG